METNIKVYTYVDGVNDIPFPDVKNQIGIYSFNYDAKRMGGAPSISGSMLYRLCLDNKWTGKEYVSFNGEKYYLKQTPSSSFSNEDQRYKHEFDFVSERIILDNTYFFDVVTGSSGSDKYVSNSSTVNFFGDIHEFAARLNYSLRYSKVGYSVVIDAGISSEAFMMSFEDQFFSQVLQSIFEVYQIPYYFVGKVIHIGFTNNAITRTFKYGSDDALLSISKNNANYKIVNRITGIGSSENIPYYYPNPSDDRESIGSAWITPSPNLMPPIYRNSGGSERFYNAKNNSYISPETGGFYIFENEYVDGNPKEHKVSFTEIKPTIKEMVNSGGQRIDVFEEFAYDDTDSDATDKDGNYLHPYFFGKLRKMDGANGFNLFDSAIEKGEMIISMTSGSCGACNWVIGVDEETQKNPVQAHANGDILRDKDGNVLRSGSPQVIQNNTQTNSVWVALKKDVDTFGVVMPNVSNNYRPTAKSDTFVILNIDLPKAYITNAENKLKEELIKYMATNNSDKFTFSISFSRIFFAENPDILSLLNENARLQIEYNSKLYELYVSSYSYKMVNTEPLPQIIVELVDVLTINKGTLQTSIDSVKQDIISSVGSVDFLKQGLKYFVRKDIKDYAKFVSFRDGLDIGNFESLLSGGTFRKDADGKSYIEVDRLYVRLKAIFENLEIKKTTYVGGEQIASPAAMKCIKVEDGEDIINPETGDVIGREEWGHYRCYYLNEQEGKKIPNDFAVGDQAISREANISSGNNVSNRYYWRLVVGLGNGYIDLSKTDKDGSSNDAPLAGDDIVQLGNRTDVTRQKAIIQSTVSLDAPSIKLLAGIDSFSLEGKAIISQGFDSITGEAAFNVYGSTYIGNKNGSSYIKYTPEKGVEIKGKLTTLSGKDVDTEFNSLKDLIDGNIQTWFGIPDPTLSNYPANEWATVKDKDNHLGDLYYSDAGKAYRFQKTGDVYNWKLIQDTDITTALAEAKKAQDAAKKAQDTADDANKNVSDLNKYIDGAFSDGIITEVEAIAIEKYKNSVNETKKNVSATYESIYSNAYLEGVKKVELKTAYDTLISSIDSLLSKISLAIADGKTTVQEKNDVDIAYSVFNDKSALYSTAIENANKSIQDKLKSLIDATDKKIAGYEYLKEALKERTTIEGGVILSSLLALGQTANDKFTVKSGLNGIFNSSKPGGGIAFWAGGSMIDMDDYVSGVIPVDAAASVDRFDGSGYRAFGNMSWNRKGELTVATQFLKVISSTGISKLEYNSITDRIILNANTVITSGNTLNIEQGAKLTVGTDSRDYIGYIKESLDLFYEMFAKVRIGNTWTIQAKYGVWTDFFLSAKGLSAESGGGGGGMDETLLWAILGNSGTEQISKTHLTTALNGYATEQWVTNKSYLVASNLVGYATQSWVESKGYLIATNTDKTNWNLAFTNNHTHANKSVLDGVTAGLITNWNNAFGWGNHANAGYSQASALNNYILKSQIGVANGIAPLDAAGLISSSYLPSYVDDVLEFATLANLPTTGEAGKIYVTINTNLTYRWTGSQYVEISKSLALGETNSTAYAGDKGKAATDAINVLRNITISAGTGLVGGGNLTANRTFSLGNSGVTAGTYGKVTVDVYGRVTAGTNLSESDLPAITIAKVTGLRADLDSRSLKTTKVIAGTGLAGGGTLAADNTLSLGASGIAAGTYIKTTVDIYGRVTGSASFVEADIPLLSISKVNTLQTNLDSRSLKTITIGAGNGLTGGGSLAANMVLNVISGNTGITVNADNIVLNTINALNSTDTIKPLSAAQGKVLWDFITDLFEKVNTGTSGAPVWAIKAKYGLYTEQFLSAKGLSSSSSGGGGGLDETLLWSILGSTGSQQINKSHLTTALGEYILNSDARLTNARPASDVAAWAKAATKPTYNYGEITGVPPAADLSNYVTLNTAQTITGAKTFNESVRFNAVYDGGFARGLYFNNEAGLTQGGVGLLGGSRQWHTAYLGIGSTPWSNTSIRVNAAGVNTDLSVSANSFIKYGGTSFQLLRADGGVATFNWSGNAGQPTWLWGGNNQHDYALWNPNNFKVESARHLDVTDIRDTNPTPDNKVSHRVTSWFNLTGTPDTNWWSGISVAGWGINYERWELAGPATGRNTQRNLHYRSGNGPTWGAWKTILDSSNWSSITDGRYLPLTGGTITGNLLIIDNTQHPLSISANGMGNKNYIMYKNGAVTLGHIGVSGVNVPSFKNASNSEYTLWHAGNDGAGSGLDADVLGGVASASYSQRSNYGATAQNSGFYKININSTAGWMTAFTVRLYQGYTYHDIVFSGYQYENSYWHAPAARLIGGDSSITVYFGYDGVKALWVAVPAGSYTGLEICNVVNGYHQVSNFATKFSISNVSSLSTIQSTKTIYPPLATNANAISATQLQTARSIWGQSFNGTGDITGKAYIDNRLGGAATISLAIGDNDTGFDWESDGKIRFMANGVNLGYWNSTEFYSHKPIHAPSFHGAFNGNISGNATTATTLQTARTIWGQSFNGGGNVSGALTGVSTISASSNITAPNFYGTLQGNVNGDISGNAVTATALQTTRSIWGQNFNGSANVSGNMTGVGTISASGRVTCADVYSSGWLRTTGQYGWYSESYGGGIYMTDSTWVRIYRDKKFYVNNTSLDSIQTIGGIQATGRGFFGTLTISGAAIFGDTIQASNTIFSTVGIYTNGYMTAKTTNTSDIRLKEDIQDFNATDIIKRLNPKSYLWNDTAKINNAIFSSKKQYGLIAQWSDGIIDDFVVDNMFNDGYYGIRYEKLIPIMLKAQLENIVKIENIEDRVKRLEKENVELKRKMEELKRGI